MELREIERVIRDLCTVTVMRHLTPADSLDTFPIQGMGAHPADGEARLLDIGCHQPAIGYYAALGWREIIGIAKEEGECSRTDTYRTEEGTIA
jgi:hypothetical protein